MVGHRRDYADIESDRREIGTSAVVAQPLAGARPASAGSMKCGLLGPVQEVDDVVVAESTITALADPEERELAAIAKSLDRVHVQVQHLGDFGRREQLADLIRHHGLLFVLVMGTDRAAVRTGLVR